MLSASQFILFAVLTYILILLNQKKMHTIDSFTDAIKLIRKIGINKETAKKVEQIYRLETSHFKSTQYKNTGSAGMESFGKAPYYGWSAQNFTARPIGTFTMPENTTGIRKTFIQFADTSDGVSFLVNYIKKHGRAGRWYSTDPNRMMQYETKLDKIKTPITDAVYM